MVPWSQGESVTAGITAMSSPAPIVGAPNSTTSSGAIMNEFGLPTGISVIYLAADGSMPAAPATTSSVSPVQPTAAQPIAVSGGGALTATATAGPTIVALPTFGPETIAARADVYAPVAVAAASTTTFPSAAASDAVTGGGIAAEPAALTTVGAGGSATDAALVEHALGVLSATASGASIVNGLRGVGAHMMVMSAAEFAANGESGAHAYFDPNTTTLYLRREDLANNDKLAAVEIAHEGTHLLDYIGHVNDAWRAQRQQQLVGTSGAFEGAALAQLRFENMMVAEARAFTFAGQVAREVGWQAPYGDPTFDAMAGANDAATYGRVWQRLLAGPYNTDHLQAAPIMVS